MSDLSFFIFFQIKFQGRVFMSKVKKMKRVTVHIDSELDYEFRRLASQKFRFEPKWYSKAIREAILLWIENNPEDEFESASEDE